MTQSIIVYRNPMEAAFWEAITNTDFPVVLFIVLTLLISVGLFILYDHITRRMRSKAPKAWRVVNDYSNLAIVVILAMSFVSSYFILV